MSYGSEHIPLEIRQKRQEKKVVITWDTGDKFEYSMEYLRVKCPCAECCGHTPDQAKLIDGKENVTITNITPIGHYAIKLQFSDEHDTGVFSWQTLYDLGVKKETLWQAYLDALKAAGKRRRASVFPIKVVN